MDAPSPCNTVLFWTTPSSVDVMCIWPLVRITQPRAHLFLVVEDVGEVGGGEGAAEGDALGAGEGDDVAAVWGAFQ